MNKYFTFKDLFDDLQSRFTYQWHNERQMQDELESHFKEIGVEFIREYSLSQKDRVDFMVGQVAFELKIKGDPLDIYRQLERYAKHDPVKAIVLVSHKNMSLPDAIAGKPAFCFNFTGKMI